MEQDLGRITTLMELRRFAAAEELLRSHLASSPESVPALQMLTETLVGLDRAGEAVTVAERAVQLAPEDDWGHIRLAEARLHAPRSSGVPHHAAIRSAQAAVHLSPHNWAAHYTLGRALLADGRPRMALDAIDEAIRLAPHNSETHNVAGLCQAALNHDKEARAAYEEALRLDPLSPTALNNLGALEVDRGRLRSASRFLRAGLANDPQMRELRMNHDTILLKVQFRLAVTLLIAGFVLCVLGAAQVPWLVRFGVGALALATATVMTRRVLRHLPRGSAAPWPLFRRVGIWQRLLLVGLMVFTLVIIVLMLVPTSVSRALALNTLSAARLGLFWVLLAGALVNLISKAFHRRKPDQT